jgi:hypothetical protein
MAQTIKRVVERDKRAYEVILSDFDDSWHVMVIQLPDQMGSEARGLTLFEGLYESQETADAAADGYLQNPGGK